MNKLYDKIFGCLAASNIGSAMGATVEGLQVDEIVEKYGVLKTLEPYAHYKQFSRPESGRLRMAGTTEDGIERQRLLCLAIEKKKGRITVQDFAKAWVEYINSDNFCVQMEPCDEPVYRMIKSGVPAEEVGKYSNYIGLVSCARSSQPIGLINAYDPWQARLDTFDVGRIFQPTYGFGLDWASAVNSAIAEALKPGTSIDSVIEAGLSVLPEGDLKTHPIEEMGVALEIADKAKGDPLSMRYEFNKVYYGKGNVYEFAMAHEIVSKGFAIFKAVAGDPKQAIITAVNFGRDTDCLAAVAGGLAGAFSGSSNIPKTWVDTVDSATEANNFTVSKKTLKQHTDIIYEAVLTEMKKSDQKRICLEKQLNN